MIQLTFLLFFFAGNHDVIEIKTFDSPSGDEFLSYPVSMCFAPQGRLFVADQGNLRIHIWEADGTYVKGFGRQGQGPGEMVNPFQMVATKDALYVWEDQRIMVIFDLDGNYQSSFRTSDARPRVFGVLKPDLFLLGHKRDTEKGSSMVVTLRNNQGETLNELLNIVNNGFIKLGEGDNNAYLKAYLPEVDIQALDNNRWYFGFSQNNDLYAVDENGKVVDKKHFEIPLQEATDEDKEVFGNLNFPGPNGERIAVKDMPNIRITYDFPKASYTHFLIKNDRIAFVLTPIGSTDGTNTGFARGTFYINDFQTGKLLSRGAYGFPEDSTVFYKNGRMLGCILNQENDYVVKELSLKGLQ